MKLEVGMYVRNKYGKIGKIIAIDLAKPRQEKYPNHPSKRWWRDKILISCYKGWITTQNIIKASYNIIDILEEGDYVNGCKVHRIANCITIILDNEENISWVKPSDIKSIVTKEQMEQMVYKVEE